VQRYTKKSGVLQGTLDLMILKTVHAMGPLHGFGIARRIEPASEDVLSLNEGTVHTSLLEPIPDRLANPPVVAGAKGNFVWLVFEHKFQNPKDTSQSVYEYSFDLFRIQNGKIQEHWDAARKNPGSPAFIPSTAPPPSTWNSAKPSTAEQQNLAIATRFEKNVVEYGHIEDIERLLSSSFIEHNPVEPVDREGLKQFIHSLPDHQFQDIKPEWKNAPVLEFSDDPLS
jgi:predicted SnoaL-like aldol condensation-catalyzing enzyme